MSCCKGRPGQGAWPVVDACAVGVLLNFDIFIAAIFVARMF